MDGNGPTTLSTTFVDSTQLIASIPSFLLSSIGTAAITVVQPSGSTSNQLPFSILGACHLGAYAAIGTRRIQHHHTHGDLAPTSWRAVRLKCPRPRFRAAQGQRRFREAAAPSSLTGSAFLTTFINTGTLTISVPASMLISPATYNVQVFNPSGPGSNIVPFSVLAPVISTLSSSSAAVGAPAFALTVTGTNYLAGSQLVFRGTTLAPTVVTATTLTVTVPASLLTTTGQANVQVLNPGGTLSNIATFTIGSLDPYTGQPLALLDCGGLTGFHAVACGYGLRFGSAGLVEFDAVVHQFRQLQRAHGDRAVESAGGRRRGQRTGH